MFLHFSCRLNVIKSMSNVRENVILTEDHNYYALGLFCLGLTTYSANIGTKADVGVFQTDTTLRPSNFSRLRYSCFNNMSNNFTNSNIINSI